MERMKELILLLNNASKAYYQLDQPILSDLEYDKLYDELLLLEEQTGVILSNSPTQNVGYTVLSDLTKVSHAFPMLSLDKTKDPQKLKSWLGENEGLLSWKLDGLTIVLTYHNGMLTQAVTRGNGQIGEDVTHNAKVFKNLPLKIPFQEELVLRGEGVISLSDFRTINEELEDGENYKNPRNLCSGTVRQLNSEIAAKRKVMFYAFAMVKANGKEFEDTKSSQMEWLKELGFYVVDYVTVTKETIETEIEQFQKAIPNIDFASDGLVLTYNSRSYSRNLGVTSKFPKDSIAFKWADEMAETTLREILWNTSRTGLINPIAVFDAVDLEGSTVSRASVHNLSILEDLQLGVGDKIQVYKANMIIPQIAENLTKKGGITIPKHCFVCGGETEVRMLREGKALYCTNPNCQAQKVRSLAHFVGRDAMNIEGLSEETLKKFVEKDFIKYYPDIYELNRFEDEIKEMEGFGEKSYQNLIASIEKSKVVLLPNFIYALGILHVGLSNAKLLCKYFDYDLEQIKRATEEELIQIEGFGSIIAHSIYRYFHDEKDMELLQQVVKKLQFELPKKEEKSEFLEGITVVITGDLQYFSNRKELQQKIENLGGKITGSVTKKTTCLINNDVLSESSKNKKAKDLGIPILSEKDFLEQYLNIKK